MCLTFSTFKYHYLGTKYELRVQLLDQNEQILRQQVISKSVQPFEPKVSVLIFTYTYTFALSQRVLFVVYENNHLCSKKIDEPNKVGAVRFSFDSFLVFTLTSKKLLDSVLEVLLLNPVLGMTCFFIRFQ